MLNPHLSCLEENFKTLLEKKCSNYKFRKLSNFFWTFTQIFLDRLSKLLPLSCPDVNLKQNFSVNLKKGFLYLSISASEQTFWYLWTMVFSVVVKIEFHVSKRSFLEKIWKIRRKTILLNCSRPLRDKIKDVLQRNCSRIVKIVFWVSRVFFREKLSLKVRTYQTFSSVFERNFYGKMVAVSQLARQNCSREVYGNFR